MQVAAPCQLAVKDVGTVSVVRFPGAAVRLEGAYLKAVAEQIFRLVEEDKRARLILDLKNVVFLASEGLGLLIRLQKRVLALGGRLTLWDLNPRVHEVFQITRLDRLFIIRADPFPAVPRRANPGYELDLSKLRDEELVVLAAEVHFRPALEALLLRYYDWSHQLIGGLGRRRTLAASDVEDAMQDAVFLILKGIARYDTLQMGKRPGFPFRAFLHRVLADGFKDFIKHLWRIEKHHDRSAEACDELSSKHRADVDSDPLAFLEWHEDKEHVRQVLNELDDTARAFVEGIMAGVRLRNIATRLGLSYHAAKRRWRRLRSRLAVRLRPMCNASPASGVRN